MARNKASKQNKYSPDKIISQFTTPNETVGRNYFKFDQYWMTRAPGHSDMETMDRFGIESFKMYLYQQ